MLQLLYGNKYEIDNFGILSISESAILLLIYSTYFALIVRFPCYFGEFTSFFKKNKQDYKEKRQDRSDEMVLA